MDKIQIIEGSLRCFWRSFLGLVPMFGLPFAIHSLLKGRKLHGSMEGQWNPASSYLNWSTAVGWLGILISTAALVLFGLFIWQIYSGGDSS